MELVLYEAARVALQQAQSVDEVAEIKNKHAALELYAKQAKDTELLERASEIKVRAERRMGELLAKREVKRGALPKKKGNGADQSRETLATLGISKDASARWQKLAAMPEKDFEKRLVDVRKAAVRAVEMSPQQRTAEKKERRKEREAELGKRQSALPDEQYGVILCDPPWRFESWSDNGMDRAPDNHYPTLDLPEMLNLPVAAMATDDAVMFMWATGPMLPQALELMRAWGFTYVANMVWVKDKIGTGYWTRYRHEMLLIGKRGNVPAPAAGEQWESVIAAPRREHSRKPDDVYVMIEDYFPTFPRCELFARGKRPGWTVWGYEA